MPKGISLKVRRDPSRPSPWYVNVPPALSESGQRQRLYFATKNLAQGCCEKLKARRDNFGVSLSALTPARIAAAAEAFKLLDPHGIDLLDAVRSHLAAFVQRNASVTFGAAFDCFLESKQTKSLKYQYEIALAKRTFEPFLEKMVCEITPAEFAPILDGLPAAARNAKMRRLRSVFNLAIKRGWMAPGTNPILRLDFADTHPQEVQTYRPEEVQAMLASALETDIALLPFLVLGFFCGIRPEGELLKLEWSDIHFGAHPQVVIRAEVSKTRRRRFVDLSENALAWIETYRQHGGSSSGKVVPFSLPILGRKRRHNRKLAGVSRQIQQGMRHTYCSNWLALHKDVNALVLQSGHDSVDTMWRNYHRGTPEAEAKQFWSIMPPEAEQRKIIRLAVS
jgi:integrase